MTCEENLLFDKQDVVAGVVCTFETQYLRGVMLSSYPSSETGELVLLVLFSRSLSVVLINSYFIVPLKTWNKILDYFDNL